MSFGINTYAADGSLGFSPNYAPFNVVKSIVLSTSSSSSSYTYSPAPGRSVSYMFQGWSTFNSSGNTVNGWKVHQSGNTVYWTRYGTPVVEVYLYIVVRA